MDGHGRFISTFVMTFKEKFSQKTLNINLCDIEEDATNYHKLLYGDLKDD